MAPPRRRRVVFHVTGFGVFNGIADNPTTHLINELPAELRKLSARRGRQAGLGSGRAAGAGAGLVRVGTTGEPQQGGGGGNDLPVEGDGFEVRTSVVLDVSATEGGRQLRELHALAAAAVRGGGLGGGVDRDAGTGTGAGGGGVGGGRARERRAEDGGVVTVFVHCGVNDGAKKFALETQAFNEATFGAPDEQGYCPACAPVDEDNPDTRHVRMTTVPVGRVLEHLGREGWGPDKVVDSRDAGRFVCNYVYYTSLGLCGDGARAGAVAVKSGDHLAGLVEGEEEEEEGGGEAAVNTIINTAGGAVGHEWHSLFIHVPPFRVIPKDRQLAFLVDCLSATAASLAGASAAGQPEASFVDQAAVPATAGTTPMCAASSTRRPVRPLAVSPCRASVLLEPPPSPSEGACSKSSPQQQPSMVSGRASPPSIWDPDAPSLVPGASPQATAGMGAGGAAGTAGEWGGRQGLSSTTTENVTETDEDAGYLRDDDEEAGGEETRRRETTAEATRRRLVETGFEELDVDAAMATTGSSHADVNMQFLLDNTALLPRGAPTEADGLYLRDFCSDTSAIAAAAAGAEGGGSYGRRRASASSAPREGHSTATHSKTISMGSPAGMGGVSPRWIGDMSPAASSVGGGKVGAGAGAPSPRLVADQSNNPDSARGRGVGLFNRFRRHKKIPSTGAAPVFSSTCDHEDAGRGGGGGGAGGGRPRSSSTTTRGASPEYSRRTTGSHRSHSPPRLRAGGPAAAAEVSSGWGATLPTGPNLRLALLVRLDLGMGPGATASQCSRAALAAARKAAGRGGGNTLAVWRDAGEAIVVLGVADARALDAVLAIGESSHLPITMVRDRIAGWVGNVGVDSCTVAAIGPAPMPAIMAVAGNLPVLK